MEKLNVAIADDNERMLNLLGEIVESQERRRYLSHYKR